MEKISNNVENFDEAKFIEDCYQFLKDESEKDSQKRVELDVESDKALEVALRDIDGLLGKVKGDYAGIFRDGNAGVKSSSYGHGIDGRSQGYQDADLEPISHEEGMQIVGYYNKLEIYDTTGHNEEMTVFEKILAYKSYNPTIVRDNVLTTLHCFRKDTPPYINNNSHIEDVYLGVKEIGKIYKNSMSEAYNALCSKFEVGMYEGSGLDKFDTLTNRDEGKYAKKFQELLYPGCESYFAMGRECNKETFEKFVRYVSSNIHKGEGNVDELEEFERQLT